MNPGVSVLICCYNGSMNLPETLKHLALQEVPADIPWEIIVIDNASTDSTAIVAKKEWEKYDVALSGFSILSQPLPGKNHAFDMGLKAAKYDFVLTCDDDNWLFPDYIARTFRIMSGNPEIGALGGCAIYEPQQPANKEVEEFTYYFVNGPQTWVETDHWVYGAGSSYRKSILIELLDKGWQQITSGRKGKSLICGEDSEICFMIYLRGYKVVADNDLKFRHFVPLKRQKIDYITNLSFWISYSHVLMNSYYPILNQDNRTIRHIINFWLLGATKTYLKSLVLLTIQKMKVWEKRTVMDKIKFNATYGTWYSLFRNRRKIIAHHEHTKDILTTKSL
ncbi:glycosyltransferase [Mucilaginibacter flavus]|uniref:glycosyltransferase n=1 Tax=Mucilaginibacter flavus TaxID=931504 RepID=UPI0025B35D84|nr:glycosyltransferase family A protein [Mucilaginibacter flavus]MDN3584407.1 glycosyltransferase family A protein [Mucilaginibacter flavus]